ncbi:MAG: DNA repair protein RadA [Lachnospiraceae bacterium]|nr:DNA repair protein RadA [Lachnospiraceae bacterium]
MAKGKKTVFFCQNCGHEENKWLGQCPACKEWNTFVEEEVVTGSSAKTRSRASAGRTSRPVTLREVTRDQEERYSSHIDELDRVLGGGIVPGSLVLVGGDPGIGKSTLLLQLCQKLSDDGRDVLYISGEESLSQIKMRSMRIGQFNDHLKLMCETNLDTIRHAIEREKPQAVIIDSIQTMYSEQVTSAPGSVSQVRESTNVLLQTAKGLAVTIFIVGHVTKEGQVAGPRVLEHMVDTVLYFEGDRYASYRILRSVKNRFGPTHEIGVFEMSSEGLREVPNPSEYMLSGKPDDAPGSIACCCMEGTRPILVEVQALVTKTSFGFPRRTASGCDYNRINLLIAVLSKRLGIDMSDEDAYVNIAGGIRLNEPAADLGIVLALVSSYRNRVIDEHVIAFGEVGLSGEVRGVTMPEQRVLEAKKIGYTTCILPQSSLRSLRGVEGIRLIGVRNIGEAVAQL